MNQYDSPKYYLKKGIEYFESGKFQDAIKYFNNVIVYFNNVIDKDSNNLKNVYKKACIEKGQCLNYLGKYQDALKCANDALEIEHDNAKALSTKAESLIYLGRKYEAIYFVDQALKSRSELEDECHARFVKSYSLQYIGHYPAALKQIKLAIDVCDDEKPSLCDDEDNAVDALITNGIIQNQNECYDKANESFDKAIKKSFKKKYRVQDIAYAFINKSVSLLGLKRKDDALDCCNKAIKYSSESLINNPKDIHAWMIKGAALFQLEFYDMAIECYDKIIMDIDCKFDFAWYLKGYALNYLERYDEALKYFEQAIAINKERANAINIEEYVTINKGDIVISKEGDIIIHEKEEVTFPKEDDIVIKEGDIDYDIDYDIGKGVSLYYLGRYNDAINCFNKVALDKDEAYKDIVLFSRGASFYAKGYYLEALDDFIRIKDDKLNCQKDTDIAPQKYTNIGACYHQLGLYEKAREYYYKAVDNDNKAIDNDNKAIEINPKLVDAYYNLGVLYYNEGNVDTAKKLFESCLNTDNNFAKAKAKEVLEKLNSNLTDTSEWFKWWFTRGIGKKLFGITLILSILFLIGIIIVMTTTTLFFYYQHMASDKQNMASDNQTSTSEMLAIYKDVTFQAITATTIPIGLLILILLFPSIRRVKVGDVIELEKLEPITSGTNIPKQMEPLFIKIGFGMQSF